MSTTVRPHVMCRKHMRVHVRVRMITRQQRAAMAARPFIHQLSTNKAIVVIYPVILSPPLSFPIPICKNISHCKAATV